MQRPAWFVCGAGGGAWGVFQGFAGAAAAAAPQGSFIRRLAGGRRASAGLQHAAIRVHVKLSFWDINHTEHFWSFGPPTQMVSGRWSLQRLVSNVCLLLFKKCTVFTDTYLFTTAGCCLLCNDLTTKVNDLFCCFCLCSCFVLGFFFFEHTHTEWSQLHGGTQKDNPKWSSEDLWRYFVHKFCIFTATLCTSAALKWQFQNHLIFTIHWLVTEKLTPLPLTQRPQLV